MPRTGLSPAELRAKAIEVALAHMRKHGYEKVRLTEVAADLGVSHAALYAHFTDKAALLDAVTEQWLNETESMLTQICARPMDPMERIRAWFLERYRIKRERYLRDLEIFRAFDSATVQQKPLVVAYLERAHRHLSSLIEAAPELTSDTPQRQATLLLTAMSAFYHPKLVVERLREPPEVLDALLERLLNTLLDGMSVRSSANRPPRRGAERPRSISVKAAGGGAKPRPERKLIDQA